MRTIEYHKVNGLNEAITITVLDEPGSGGANHVYKMDLDLGNAIAEACEIKFQKGPIKEVGVNGISGEALLAVVIDRLRCFQAGPFACRDNAIALTKLEEAVMWLHKRTHKRMRRGVEGTNQK